MAEYVDGGGARRGPWRSEYAREAIREDHVFCCYLYSYSYS